MAPREYCNFNLETIGTMLLYAAASSNLLLVNKLCMKRVAAPSLVSTLQFCATAACVLFLYATKQVPVDGFSLARLRANGMYVVLFVIAIYCNLQAIKNSNIETVLVFRCCAPLVVCVIEWLLLGRQLPEVRSIAALLTIGLGAAGYVVHDDAFLLDGWSAYKWAGAYFTAICIETAFAKYVVPGGSNPSWLHVPCVTELPAPSDMCTRVLLDINTGPSKKGTSWPSSIGRACGGQPSTRTHSRSCRWLSSV